jgi:hypothetical protein
MICCLEFGRRGGGEEGWPARGIYKFMWWVACVTEKLDRARIRRTCMCCGVYKAANARDATLILRWSHAHAAACKIFYDVSIENIGKEISVADSSDVRAGLHAINVNHPGQIPGTCIRNSVRTYVSLLLSLLCSVGLVCA